MPCIAISIFCPSQSSYVHSPNPVPPSPSLLPHMTKDQMRLPSGGECCDSTGKGKEGKREEERERGGLYNDVIDVTRNPLLAFLHVPHLVFHTQVVGIHYYHAARATRTARSL